MTKMTTGAPVTASTAMSNCWWWAELDMSPGGMCGYQTNQMMRSAASARMIQIRKSRRPCRGSDRGGVPPLSLGRCHELTTFMKPDM